MIKLSDLSVYDENITIKELKELIKKKYPYVCPKCKGKGKIWIPDEFGDGRTGNYFTQCDICDGYGRTKKEMKPKYQIIGYE